MARAVSARAASAKPAETVKQAESANVKVNGTAAARSRSKKSEETPAINGTADKDAPAAKPAPRSRAKKTATPAPEPAPAPAKNTKRKKDADSEAEDEPEPEAKKAKVAKTATESESKPAKAAKPSAAQPKGPRRVRGKKTEINDIRYTHPLKVFVFGEGGQGELGLGATKKAIDVKRPRYNEALSNQNVVKVVCGGMHVLALTKDNKILSWGVNDNDALGRDISREDIVMRDMDDDASDSDSEDETGGLNNSEATPTAISMEHFPENTVFVDIAAGDSCSFALTTEGAVYGWGTFRKNDGILGFSRTLPTAKYPTYIESVTKVTQIVCGTNHVFALTKDKHVWAWGNGQQNQLGRRVTERGLIEALAPTRLGFHDTGYGRPTSKIAHLSSGDYHGFAIGDDGHVWSWGVNNYCETGNPQSVGAEDASVLAPKIVAPLEGKDVIHIAAGSHHNVAILKDGQALVWGRCDGSQTGLTSEYLNAIDDEARLLKNNGRPKILIEPTPLPDIKNAVYAACGPDNSIVITKEGKAYSWGFSANYQTGQGTDDDINTPTMIDNTAVRETKLTWAGCGGQYSVLASKK